MLHLIPRDPTHGTGIATHTPVKHFILNISNRLTLLVTFLMLYHSSAPAMSCNGDLELEPNIPPSVEVPASLEAAYRRRPQETANGHIVWQTLDVESTQHGPYYVIKFASNEERLVSYYRKVCSNNSIFRVDSSDPFIARVAAPETINNIWGLRDGGPFQFKGVSYDGIPMQAYEFYTPQGIWPVSIRSFLTHDMIEHAETIYRWATMPDSQWPRVGKLVQEAREWRSQSSLSAHGVHEHYDKFLRSIFGSIEDGSNGMISQILHGRPISDPSLVKTMNNQIRQKLDAVEIEISVTR